MPNSFSIRPATQADISALSRLVIQLYAAELPGALTGPIDGQEALFRFTLEANGESALKNRYVLCGKNRDILGTGMIQFSDEPTFERAPDGTVSRAFRLLGMPATLKLFATVARSLIGVQKHGDTNSALIHSVVVDETLRGKGVGVQLMTHLEEKIREHGVKRSRIQVLEDNIAAVPFYKKLGYKQIWKSPWWVSTLSWSSLEMEKGLT